MKLMQLLGLCRHEENYRSWCLIPDELAGITIKNRVRAPKERFKEGWQMPIRWMKQLLEESSIMDEHSSSWEREKPRGNIEEVCKQGSHSEKEQDTLKLQPIQYCRNYGLDLKKNCFLYTWMDLLPSSFQNFRCITSWHKISKPVNSVGFKSDWNQHYFCLNKGLN